MLTSLNNNTISNKKSISTAVNSDAIASHHWAEWKESAVSDDIIKLNVRTVYDAREVDKILGRNTSRKWKHSNDLIPAWYAAGIDPLTGEATLQGVQVKPDTPPQSKNGKPQKYLSASGMETAPLFLQTTIEAYWKSIIDDRLQFVIITEGAKKAAAGLSAGFPSISIPGVTTCRKKGRLHPSLELFAVLGRTFYLCFDNDILYKKPVQDGLTGLAKELAARGSKVMIIRLPPGDAKGMDDYLSLHDKEAFDRLISSASTFEEWKEELAELQMESSDDEPQSKIAKNFQIINEAWGESLQYNTLKKEIEFNGFPVDIEHLKLMIGLQFPVNISKEDAFMIVEYIAKQNSYSPVVDYLDEVEAKFPDIDPLFLDGLAKLFFGTDDPLHAKYLKKFLVASVARARNPGCWMDCALLLFGRQGIRKSTFWRTLYGDDFFSDDLGNSSDKDERMKMHRFWCLEWSEFETVYKHKDVETLKAFLARKHETFRTPYDRLPKDYKRSCLFVGTTNKEEILHDPTGSRRFWIIPVSRSIPTEEVQKLRDRIWATANALYKWGYSYRLTDDEEAQREIQNEQYDAVDPWEEIIASLMDDRLHITLNEIYDKLEIGIAHRDTRNKTRITSVLRRLNYEPVRIKVSGKWVRGWKKRNIFQKSSGSSGSDVFLSAETTAQQDSQPAPVENKVVDQVRHDTLPNSDPVEEVKSAIPLSQAHSNDSSDFSSQKSAETEIPVSQAHSKASSPSDPLDSPDPLLLEIKEKFPVGHWVKYAGQHLAQVTGYASNGDIYLNLDGGDRSKVFGSYPLEKCTALSKLETLELGLSIKLTGLCLAKTPEFVEGRFYWSQELHQRVKIVQIFEEKSGDFNKPCALVMREEAPPKHISLTGLRACYDSPASNLKVNDVVVVWTGGNREEPETAVGVVSKLDSQWVWVRPLRNDSLAPAKKFYAHRVVRADG